MFEGLNAPFGARCFLTGSPSRPRKTTRTGSLNAPFGARCFLTTRHHADARGHRAVLMHLLALGAF